MLDWALRRQLPDPRGVALILILGGGPAQWLKGDLNGTVPSIAESESPQLDDVLAGDFLPTRA